MDLLIHTLSQLIATWLIQPKFLTRRHFAMSRNQLIENYRNLLNGYQELVGVLRGCMDENTPDDYVKLLHELENALFVARTGYWFYPGRHVLLPVTVCMDNILRLPTNVRGPVKVHGRVADLGRQLATETAKFAEFYKQEVGGAITVGGCIGFCQHFIVAFLKQTGIWTEMLRSRVVEAVSYDAMLAFVSRSLCRIGLSAAFAPIVVSIIVGSMAGVIHFYFYPELCRQAWVGLENAFQTSEAFKSAFFRILQRLAGVFDQNAPLQPLLL